MPTGEFFLKFSDFEKDKKQNQKHAKLQKILLPQPSHHLKRTNIKTPTIDKPTLYHIILFFSEGQEPFAIQLNIPNILKNNTSTFHQDPLEISVFEEDPAIMH